LKEFDEHIYAMINHLNIYKDNYFSNNLCEDKSPKNTKTIIFRFSPLGRCYYKQLLTGNDSLILSADKLSPGLWSSYFFSNRDKLQRIHPKILSFKMMQKRLAETPTSEVVKSDFL